MSDSTRLFVLEQQIKQLIWVLRKLEVTEFPGVDFELKAYRTVLELIERLRKGETK